MRPIVEARGLHTYFGSSHILRGVSLKLSPGETVWTTPVRESFHHSSLFFYLARPVRTITDAERGRRPAPTW